MPQNALANESSPYLLQHAANPVDWQPWGEEAIAAARELDKPIFLSVGYSACHWCHVMAHESFEDEETAALLNERFVSIKLDREERPDLDALYMRAVMLMTGSGGWPLSVFLTPDLRPFYGGTYFPKEPRYGMPSFRQVLEGVSETYADRRDELERSAARTFAAVERSFRPSTGGPPPGPVPAERAESRLASRIDPIHGGFGGSPKFPQPALLDFLLARAAAAPGGAEASPVIETLFAMESGGIRDQVGGGFHRYSVDEEWLVPHFEKMLYDNAQLAALYFRAYGWTGLERLREVGEEVLADMERSMAAPGGGFVAALDADSEGREGAFYVWSLAEWNEVLGGDGPWMAGLYGVTEAGNFEGKSIPSRRDAFETAEAAAGLAGEDLRRRIDANIARLRQAREARVHPGVDTKVLTDWNALMASACAEACLSAGEERHLERAEEVLEGIWQRCRKDGILYHVWDGKTAKVPGFLDDYAFLARAEWDAFCACGKEIHLERLEILVKDIVHRFWDADAGTLYETASEAVGRTASPMRVRNAEDGVLPSGLSAAARVLLGWESLTADAAIRAVLDGILKGEAAALADHPEAVPLLAAVAAQRSRPPVNIVISGRSDDGAALSLLQDARRWALPTETVLPLFADRVSEAGAEALPLLAGRRSEQDGPMAYVCVGGACRLPVATAGELVKLLEEAREAANKD